MNVTAELQNSPALVAEFRRLGRRLDMSAQDVMERAARNVATSAMRMTIPFGIKTEHHDLGKFAARRGVSRALSPVGGMATLQQALAHHQSARVNGKVSRGVEKLRVSREVYDKAQETVQSRVGKAKSAWGQAALKFGAPRIPKWIGKHANRWTQAQKTTRRWRPGATMTSRLRYASDALPTRLQNKAVESGMRNALRGMQRQIERQAGIFNRRQRR
jgi:hypothetical protein